MPIFEALKGSSNANATLDYCEKEEILDKKSGIAIKKCILKAGVNCDIEDIRDDFAETRNHFNKSGGRQAMHFVLSFSPEELPNNPDNQEKCLEIGMDLASKIAPGHESGCFIHADHDHLHCHIVTNSVNYETGRKFQMKKNVDLVAFREISDQVCQSHGIQTLEPYTGEKTKESNYEKRLRERGITPWKQEIKIAIDYAKRQAVDIDSYKRLLAEKGVEMYQRGEKTIGYIHVGQREKGNTKYKLRETNKALGEGYLLKDIEKAFAHNKAISLHTPEKQNPIERRNIAVKSTPPLPPINDNSEFEETVKNTQDKKARIKETTSQNLSEDTTEEERLEAKRKEKFELQQAELEKEIQLKEHQDIEELMKLLNDIYPSTFHQERFKNEGDSPYYFGGATRKLFKVEHAPSKHEMIIAKRIDSNYETVATHTLDSPENIKKAEREVSELVDHEYKRIKHYQRSQQMRGRER